MFSKARATDQQKSMTISWRRIRHTWTFQTIVKAKEQGWTWLGPRYISQNHLWHVLHVTFQNGLPDISDLSEHSLDKASFTFHRFQQFKLSFIKMCKMQGFDCLASLVFTLYLVRDNASITPFIHIANSTNYTERSIIVHTTHNGQ